jgi:hypothetical protein
MKWSMDHVLTWCFMTEFATSVTFKSRSNQKPGIMSCILIRCTYDNTLYKVQSLLLLLLLLLLLVLLSPI